MFGFLRRNSPAVRVDHAHADGTPVAPGPSDALIAAIDAQLRAIAEIPRSERTAQQLDYEDRLLDARSAPTSVRPVVRPAVPVIPGPDSERRPS